MARKSFNLNFLFFPLSGGSLCSSRNIFSLLLNEPRGRNNRKFVRQSVHRSVSFPWGTNHVCCSCGRSRYLHEQQRLYFCAEHFELFLSWGWRASANPDSKTRLGPMSGPDSLGRFFLTNGQISPWLSTRVRTREWVLRSLGKQAGWFNSTCTVLICNRSSNFASNCACHVNLWICTQIKW